MLNTVLKIVFQNFNHLDEKIFGVLQDKNNNNKKKRFLLVPKLQLYFLILVDENNVISLVKWKQYMNTFIYYKL